jgi:PTS system nitrogen regulatory IIA component
MKEVLTPEDAAELLQLSKYTVKDYARKGKIPAKKVGTVWRFSRKSLLDWLSASSATPELREYTNKEIKEFLAADRLDAQTAEKVYRLLRQKF